MKIAIDVWSDVICPWCYIGKRRMEAALAKFGQQEGRSASEVTLKRVMRGYFTEGVAIGDRDELVKLGVDLGLDEDETRDALLSDAFADEVREDLKVARENGISGVPAFVFNDQYLVSGAQPAETLLAVLEKVHAE